MNKLICWSAAFLLSACSTTPDNSSAPLTDSESVDALSAEENVVGEDSSAPVKEEDALEQDIFTDELDDAAGAAQDFDSVSEQLEDVVNERREQRRQEESDETASEESNIPAPDITADFERCSAPGGQMNIYDLQNPQCPDHFDPEPTEAPGAYIFLEDVIITAIFSDTVFVQEEAGGPYSGVSVYLGPFFGGDLKRGDVVSLEGYYYEFFGNTQLTVEKLTVTGQQAVPEPYSALHPSHLATDGPLAEMFEGVLVKVNNVKTISTKPDCPNDFKEFMVTGDLRIDDMGVLWDAKLGDSFSSITGVMHYTFDNHKLEPRTDDDIQWLGKGNVNSVSKCIEGDCQVPISEFGSRTVIVNEIMFDPTGQDTGKEWIELFNPTNQTVDIYGWEIRDCADQKFKITGPDLKLAPGQFVVVGASADTTTNGGVEVDVSYGSGFYMPNTVGSVLLFNGPGPSAKLVDQVRYMVFQDWDWFESGHSILRNNAQSDGTNSESWSLSDDPYGTGDNFGSPGQ